jgi:hypothetical protein
MGIVVINKVLVMQAELAKTAVPVRQNPSSTAATKRAKNPFCRIASTLDEASKWF